MQYKYFSLLFVQVLHVLDLTMACITPLGAMGYRTHILNCTSIISMMRHYEMKLPPLERRYIYESASNEKDRNEHIVCCSDDFRPMEDFKSVGATILRNHDAICGDNTHKRIAFGVETTFMTHPWSALLVYKDSQPFKCGGTLVTNRYVLTAAHCVVTDYYPLIAVRLREHNTTSEIDCLEDVGGFLRCAQPVLNVGIEKVTIHSEYSTTTLDNDIALIRLDRTIIFERSLRHICLPEFQSQEFDKPFGTVSGWGITENQTQSDVLREADVPIFNLNHCRKIYRHNVFDEKKICASGENEIDVCKADSGGPLSLRIGGQLRKMRYLQAGILSQGIVTCGSKRNFPAVFTRIAAYMDWLKSNIEM